MRSRGSSKKKRKRRGDGGDLFGTLRDKLVKHVLSFLPSREAARLPEFAAGDAPLLLASPSSSPLLVAPSSSRARAQHRPRGLESRPAAPPPTAPGSSLRSLLLAPSSLLVSPSSSPLLHRRPPLCYEQQDRRIQPADPPYDERRDHYEYDDERPKVDAHVDLWIDHALSACRARSLTVRTKTKYTSWRPRSPLAFASPHLTRLHLEHVHLLDGLLDFTRCPALLELTLVRCTLEGDALVSPWLDRLSVVDCEIEIGDWISTPRLRCLELSGRYGKEEAALFLERDSMPWLTDPSIQHSGNTTIYSQKR
ncbi:unnamed protein product [Alopecurus aequalis]